MGIRKVPISKIFQENPNFNPAGKNPRERANRPLTNKERNEIRRKAFERHEKIKARKERMAAKNYARWKLGLTYKISRYVRIIGGSLAFLLILDHFLPKTIHTTTITDFSISTKSTNLFASEDNHRIATGYNIKFCDR